MPSTYLEMPEEETEHIIRYIEVPSNKGCCLGIYTGFENSYGDIRMYPVLISESVDKTNSLNIRYRPATSFEEALNLSSEEILEESQIIKITIPSYESELDNYYLLIIYQHPTNLSIE